MQFRLGPMHKSIYGMHNTKYCISLTRGEGVQITCMIITGGSANNSRGVYILRIIMTGGVQIIRIIMTWECIFQGSAYPTLHPHQLKLGG